MKIKVKDTIAGYLFVLPVLLGILIFTLTPVLLSFYFSFTKYDNIRPPTFIGLENYAKLLRDGRFLHSLKITSIYAFSSVIIGLVLSFFLSLLLYQKLKGIKFFRAVLYAPVVVPTVASAGIWINLYNATEVGRFNYIITALGFEPFPFTSSSKTALFSLILMSFWTIGSSMLIWLAGFNGISKSYYEAADIDGAKRGQKLFKITLPMMSPVIFYNLIIGVIAALQTFNNAYLMSPRGSGGPLYSTYLLALGIYRTGIIELKMGYASAQAWVLFLIIFVLTFIIFKTSSWVFYADEEV